MHHINVCQLPCFELLVCLAKSTVILILSKTTLFKFQQNSGAIYRVFGSIVTKILILTKIIYISIHLRKSGMNSKFECKNHAWRS
jgi:hypothetical protein